jgi:hypothetical protein
MQRNVLKQKHCPATGQDPSQPRLRPRAMVNTTDTQRPTGDVRRSRVTASHTTTGDQSFDNKKPTTASIVAPADSLKEQYHGLTPRSCRSAQQTVETKKRSLTRGPTSGRGRARGPRQRLDMSTPRKAEHDPDRQGGHNVVISSRARNSRAVATLNH